jgi:hypothetical protein
MGAINIDDGLRARSRGQLMRATSLLHKMFIAIREETFWYEILHIEERHGILYFVHNEGSRDASIGNFVFQVLSKDMVKDGQDRTSLLMYSECTQFIVDMMTQIQSFVASE